MNAGGWLVAVVGAAMALVAGGFALRRAVLDARRTPVPGFDGVYCERLPPEAVGRHLNLALTCLGAVWPEQQAFMRRQLSGWTVVGMGPGPWASGGREVGGLLDTWGMRLEVADDMDGLAHELAHLFERSFDGRADNSHVTWKMNGIYAAVGAYQAGRKGLA